MTFSLADRCIIANYHYVEDPRPDFSGIHPCSPAEFDRQISFFAHHYRFVSVPELFDAVKNNNNEKLCAITFDDGLRDQEINAVPILKKYNATATFFIITATLNGRVPVAHKIHTVLSRMSARDLREAFNAFLLDNVPDERDRFFIPDDRRITEKRRYDDMISANVKETLTTVPIALSDTFLNHMLARLGVEESLLAQELFMAREGIKKLAKNNFFIENHTHNHYDMSLLDHKTLHKECETAVLFFTDMMGYAPCVMAYPYGRLPENEEVLKEYGFTHAVTVESRAVTHSDNILQIPRFDTNDIKVFLDIPQT